MLSRIRFRLTHRKGVMLKDVCVHDGYTGIQDFNIDRPIIISADVVSASVRLRQSMAFGKI